MNAATSHSAVWHIKSMEVQPQPMYALTEYVLFSHCISHIHISQATIVEYFKIEFLITVKRGHN